MDTLLQALRQPEYMHVLLNPLPVYGLAVALLGLIAALYLGSRSGQITALVLIFGSGLSAWPVASYGEKAEDGILASADPDGQAWLKEHARRADIVIYLFYGLAAVAAGAIFLPKKWPGSQTILTVLTLILAAASLLGGAWIGYAGGRIRHREFRIGPPPPAAEHDKADR